MRVVVPGIKAKERPRFGKCGSVRTPAATKLYESKVRRCYKKQGGVYLNGFVRARLELYYKIPKSYTKKRIEVIRNGLEHPTKKPDIDNVAKIILDALNKVAYEDDKQVVELTVIKRWTFDDERVEFELEEM